MSDKLIDMKNGLKIFCEAAGVDYEEVSLVLYETGYIDEKDYIDMYDSEKEG